MRDKHALTSLHSERPFFLLLLLLCVNSYFTKAARGSFGSNEGLMTQNAGRGEESEDFWFKSKSLMKGRARADAIRQSLLGGSVEDDGKSAVWVVDPLDFEVVQRNLRQNGETKLANVVSDVLGNNVELRVTLRGRPINPRATGRGGPYRAVASLGRKIEKRVKKKKLAKVPRRIVSFFTGADRKRIVRTAWNVVTDPITDVEMSSSSQSPSTVSPYLRESYEEVTRRSYEMVEIEVVLSKTGKNSPPPVVVYQFPMCRGSLNPDALVAASRGKVTVFPKGRRGKLSAGAGKGIDVGEVAMYVGFGPGLVDPAWAKGRKFFWKGRDPGLIF